MNIRQKIIDIAEKKLESPSRRKRDRLRKKGLDITYTFWWWVAKRFEYKGELSYVCYKLAKFYSGNINNFIGIKISDVVVLNNTIFVYLGRPGLMIGKGGETIDKLTEHINTNEFGEKVCNYKISLIEDLRSWSSMFYDHLNRSYGS